MFTEPINIPKTERYYTVEYVPSGSKTALPPAIHLTGHLLKAAGFDTSFTFTVKILNGCLALITDSEDVRAIKQQNQQQQAQLSAIKHTMRGADSRLYQWLKGKLSGSSGEYSKVI